MRVLPILSTMLAFSLGAADAEIKIGLGVEKMEIQGEAKAFKVSPGTKLWAWTRVTDAGDSIRVVFEKGGKAVFSQDLKVPRSPYRTNACRTFRAGDGGDWTVKVLGAEGKELGSAAFNVGVAP